MPRRLAREPVTPPSAGVGRERGRGGGFGGRRALVRPRRARPRVRCGGGGGLGGGSPGSASLLGILVLADFRGDVKVARYSASRSVLVGLRDGSGGSSKKEWALRWETSDRCGCIVLERPAMDPRAPPPTDPLASFASKRRLFAPSLRELGVGRQWAPGGAAVGAQGFGGARMGARRCPAPEGEGRDRWARQRPGRGVQSTPRRRPRPAATLAKYCHRCLRRARRVLPPRWGEPEGSNACQTVSLSTPITRQGGGQWSYAVYFHPISIPIVREDRTLGQ